MYKPWFSSTKSPSGSASKSWFVWEQVATADRRRLESGVSSKALRDTDLANTVTAPPRQPFVGDAAHRQPDECQGRELRHVSEVGVQSIR
jgi:hypothetical protein